MTGHPTSEIAVRVRRLEERLIDAGLTDDAQLDAIIGQVLSGSPANGARVVAGGDGSIAKPVIVANLISTSWASR